MPKALDQIHCQSFMRQLLHLLLLLPFVHSYFVQVTEQVGRMVNNKFSLHQAINCIYLSIITLLITVGPTFVGFGGLKKELINHMYTGEGIYSTYCLKAVCDIKIASLLMFKRFFKPNEIVEIRLMLSNDTKSENQASQILSPIQGNAIVAHEVHETENEKLSPKLAINEQINRLQKQFPKGASAYSIRHSVTTELAKLGTSERDLATFTLHFQNSRTVQQYCIFAFSIRANDIAWQLTSNLGQDNERLDYVSILRGEIRRERGYQLISLSHLKTRGEIEIRREFPRELKDQTSGMMLKEGQSE
ncbi:MAG: hypothetical protein EZS28_007392 [Streblomastix strix]|uniref:Uncharacterized protein n=1 Tax=Streblomastix strix TaxID=222440 RepID=A0A5J4WQP4_9EUKA|nr:MAG: hypothetical protein EZS28_007392 [Streblomastix strix]